MDKMELMLGYKPSREVRIALLKESKETGKSLQEVIGTSGIIPLMPETAVLGEDLKFSYKGQRITVQEFEKINPLGRWAKLIVIGRHETIEQYRKTKE